MTGQGQAATASSSRRAAGPATLLYDDECQVCQHIAAWVRRRVAQPAATDIGGRLELRGIGEDPQALKALSPDLDIWEAYDTVHVLMPDGSMRRGGEAVAEVLRRLPATRWFTGCLDWSLFGWRPFQQALNGAYAVLAAVRPLLGCASCGLPNRWIRPLVWLIQEARSMFGRTAVPAVPGRHHTPH